MKITEYRFIKVKYESAVDWNIKTDYMRCSPKFNGHPWYDFVLAKIGGGLVFARLVFVFTCRVSRLNYRLALVEVLDKQTRTSTRNVDKKLSIHRWHIRHRKRCEVISLDCIVRGAVLVGDTKHTGDFFVIDALDDDMYLRVMRMT